MDSNYLKIGPVTGHVPFVDTITTDASTSGWLTHKDQTKTNIEPAPKGAEDPEPSGPEIFDAFKDTQGRFRTQSLFWETRHASYPAYFTLKKHDKDQYISMYRKYMEIADPTEYQVAIQLLGSWSHWEALKKSKWFMEHLTEWRKELKVKMESQRYYEMLGVEARSGAGTPPAIQATKWLADKYGPKGHSKRGRPSKDETEGYIKQVKKEAEDLAEDAERIGVKT